MVTPVISRQQQAEWDGLIAEQADSVVPPSYMQQGEILNRPTEANPMALRVSDLRFKGYVEVWDSRTGIQSLQPYWLLWQTMRKTREDGSLVFTRTNPHIEPNYGADLFCPLNPDSPEYSLLKGMGFQPCKKQHIPHQDGLMRHVKKSHSRAWDAMERERTEKIRNEDRKLQFDMLKAMTDAVARGVMLPDAVPTQAAILAAQTVASPTDLPDVAFRAECKCGNSYGATTDKQAQNKLRLHQRHCKA